MRRGLLALATAAIVVTSAAGSSAATPRTIWFSGHRWDVRDGPELSGPGPNRFSDGRRTVWLGLPRTGAPRTSCCPVPPSFPLRRA